MAATYTGKYNLGKQENTADKFDMSVITSNMDIIDTALFNKVDKIDGKQLSTNDYTSAEKTIVSGIATTYAKKTDLDSYAKTTDLDSYAKTTDLATIDTRLESKVDKVTGKQLSTNDYTSAEKTIVAGISTTYAKKTDLDKYVKLDVFANAMGNTSRLLGIELNDYTYTVNTSANTSTITKYNGSDINVTVPFILEGRPVISIGQDAYKDKTNIEKLTILEGVTSLGQGCFWGCSKLSSIRLPESVVTISPYLFSYCYALINVYLPNSITALPNYTFRSCSLLSDITIPSTVSTIGVDCFAGCTALTTITVNKATGSITGAPWGAPSASIVWTG